MADMDTAAASRQAWWLVYEGYRAGLGVPGLDDDLRACLMRQMGRAASLSGDSSPDPPPARHPGPPAENVLRLVPGGV